MFRAVSAALLCALVVLASACSSPTASSPAPTAAASKSSAAPTAAAAKSSAAPTAAANGKVWKLSFSTYTPPTHHVTKVFEQYAKDVEKATNGRVKITIYPGGTLTTAAQTYDGVVKDIADMGFSFMSYNAGRFPLMEVVDLPLPGVKDSEQASLEAWAVYNKFKPKEMSDIKALGMLSMAGASFFTNNKPITKMEDLKGLQIRGTGNDTKIIEALGGTAVAMPITDAYVALQKGVVDGILTDDAAALSYKFGDVVHHKVDFPGGLRQATAWFGMNLKVWDSMPPDIQKEVADVSDQYVAKLGASRDEENTKGVTYVKSAGVQLTNLSQSEIDRWNKALQPLRDEYVKKVGAKGLPAQAALDYAISELQKIQK